MLRKKFYIFLPYFRNWVIIWYILEVVVIAIHYNTKSLSRLNVVEGTSPSHIVMIFIFHQLENLWSHGLVFHLTGAISVLSVQQLQRFLETILIKFIQLVERRFKMLVLSLCIADMIASQQSFVGVQRKGINWFKLVSG